MSEGGSTPQKLVIRSRKGRADQSFVSFVTAGAMTSFLILGLIAAFLLYRGFEIFKDFGLGFITSSTWDAGSVESGVAPSFGVAAMLVGSIVISVIALVVALPFAIATALFLEYYAPRRLRLVLTSLLDLIAAIPSVVYGLWGYIVLMPIGVNIAEFLNKWLGWIPLFKVPAPIFERSPFIAGLLLALMILPIITSVAREVYSRAPRDQVDAAFALGSTKWGALRTVVLPFGRSGLVGGAMLGLGRALGETVAVYLVLNLVFKVNFQILASAGGNVASLIATRFGEAGDYELKALMAAGLVLFLLTLLVNAIATAIVNRAAKSGKS